MLCKFGYNPLPDKRALVFLLALTNRGGLVWWRVCRPGPTSTPKKHNFSMLFPYFLRKPKCEEVEALISEKSVFIKENLKIKNGCLSRVSLLKLSNQVSASSITLWLVINSQRDPSESLKAWTLSFDSLRKLYTVFHGPNIKARKLFPEIEILKYSSTLQQVDTVVYEKFDFTAIR